MTFSLIWISGCGKDDSADSFIGTWVAETIEVSGCADEGRNGTEEVPCDDSCYRLELRGDGNYTFQQDFTVESGFWVLDGKLKLCMNEEDETVCTEYLPVLTQGGLELSSDSTSSGCVTTYFFMKADPADTIQ
jgi:hypothetical protein